MRKHNFQVSLLRSVQEEGSLIWSDLHCKSPGSGFGPQQSLFPHFNSALLSVLEDPRCMKGKTKQDLLELEHLNWKQKQLFHQVLQSGDQVCLSIPIRFYVFHKLGLCIQHVSMLKSDVLILSDFFLCCVECVVVRGGLVLIFSRGAWSRGAFYPITQRMQLEPYLQKIYTFITTITSAVIRLKK